MTFWKLITYQRITKYGFRENEYNCDNIPKLKNAQQEVINGSESCSQRHLGNSSASYETVNYRLIFVEFGAQTEKPLLAGIHACTTYSFDFIG
jgi:hypothetical protein